MKLGYVVSNKTQEELIFIIEKSMQNKNIQALKCIWIVK